jgi:putative ABC transport system permease protein
LIALARKTLVHEWRRFVPAVLGIGFAGLLLLVQAALVLGIFGSAAVSVTASSADLWAGYPGTQSVNFGRAIGADVEMRLRSDPAVKDVEPYLWVEGDWHGSLPGSGGVSVFVSGLRSDRHGMVFSQLLNGELRERLREPGAVIVDRSDLAQLGVALDGVDPGAGSSRAWINGVPVTVIAALPGLRALGGVNVLASMETARRLETPERSGNARSVGGPTYFVARLHDPAQAAGVQARLQPGKSFGPVEVWTAADFAQRSQLYWMLDTGAGVAVFFMACIVCLVGAVVTSQSLTAVVAASAREYAMLNALGASLGALSRVVLEQAVWIGFAGLAVAAVTGTTLLWLAAQYDVPVAMNLPVAAGCALLVGGLALVAGLLAVRGLLRAEPALLLR